MKKLILAFLVLGLAIASAKTYSVTLFQATVVAGTELKAGEYKLDLGTDRVKITNGRNTVESAVKVEQSDTKFGSTTVRYANNEGKARVQEIRLGGTKLKLVFN